MTTLYLDVSSIGVVPTVHLSDIPEAGGDLEDYVAALFQASGYFVEKNVTERDPGDVLELDLVASSFGSMKRSL